MAAISRSPRFGDVMRWTGPGNHGWLAMWIGPHPLDRNAFALKRPGAPDLTSSSMDKDDRWQPVIWTEDTPDGPR